MCYSLGRAEAHGILRRKQPRDNVPLVRMVKKKENAIPGQVFSFMLCQRNVTSSFYCTFSSSRPCASCQTRQHNKRKLVHNKDLKRHAQRPNFYHMSCCNYGLMLLGLRTMVTFMTTTAALLAGVPLLMTICFLGLQIVKASWHKAHQNLSGMWQQMQLRKLLSSKIYFMNLILIVPGLSL